MEAACLSTTAHHCLRNNWRAAKNRPIEAMNGKREAHEND
jgi:hypothetical protein